MCIRDSVCTYQAISGAGKTFATMPEIIDNVIPYIGGEEEKSEKEPLKIWGHIEGKEIVSANGPVITAQCLRVPVSDGHMAAVFVSFEKKPSKEEILEALSLIHISSARKTFFQRGFFYRTIIFVVRKISRFIVFLSLIHIYTLRPNR